MRGIRAETRACCAWQVRNVGQGELVVAEGCVAELATLLGGGLLVCCCVVDAVLIGCVVVAVDGAGVEVAEGVVADELVDDELDEELDVLDGVAGAELCPFPSA